LRGVRRVEIGGALRMVPKVTEKDVATNARACETCGGSASWKWRGIRAPSYVRTNRGFGLVRAHDRDDVRLRERAHASDVAAFLDEAKRPGGLFYGGSPPPWMDDPAEWVTETEGHLPASLAD
jgi:hypothetical protein